MTKSDRIHYTIIPGPGFISLPSLFFSYYFVNSKGLVAEKHAKNFSLTKFNICIAILISSGLCLIH